jgi:uncharacterized protein YggE
MFKPLNPNVLIAAIAAVAVGFFAFKQPAAQAQTPPTKPVSTLLTSGEALINVVPDEVTLYLGVETSDKDLSAAKRANDERIAKLIAFAKQQGVPEEKIRTDYLNIEPRYSDGYTSREFVGYFVRRSLSITLRDLSKFDSLLSGSLESGVNYVHNIAFRTTELRKHRDEARKLAVRAAREKAELLAGEMGLRVVRVANISEDVYSGGWYYSGWWGARSGAQSQNVVQNSAGQSTSADSILAPGQIGVRAFVNVTFELGTQD